MGDETSHSDICSAGRVRAWAAREEGWVHSQLSHFSWMLVHLSIHPSIHLLTCLIHSMMTDWAALRL